VKHVVLNTRHAWQQPNAKNKTAQTNSTRCKRYADANRNDLDRNGRSK